MPKKSPKEMLAELEARCRKANLNLDDVLDALASRRSCESRRKAIATIEHLWPPDNSVYGQELLWKALCRSWHSLPDEVLQQLLYLNLQEEHKPDPKRRPL